MNSLLLKLNETHPNEIYQNMQQKGEMVYEIDDSKIVLDKDDFQYGTQAKKGYAMAWREGITVFISTTRNREMMARGLVKDLARRLQTLRKEIGYSPTDIIDTAYILDLDPESLEMIKEKADELAFLVRVKHVDFTDTAKEYKQEDIDGLKVRISVE